MTLFRGLFVRKDATRGTSAVEARKSLAGIFLPSGAHGARPGVLDGLTVAGTAGWAYSVAAGHVVLSRSAADGAILAGNDAGASVSTSPAPASGSRIDLIWLKHSDVDAGDPTSEIALGVTEGTAAASPVAPVLPAGAFELARATVAAGASSTSHASVTITATATRTGMRGGQVTAPTLASLEALYPSAPAGLTAWVTSENGVYVRAGGQWRLLWQDTGWVTSGIAVTGNSNFIVSAYAMRRRGDHVKGRITATFTGNTLSSDAAGDFANVTLPTIPAEWSPTGYSAPITMERVGAAVSFGWAETTGQLRLISSSLQSAVVLATGATYVIDLDHVTR